MPIVVVAGGEILETHLDLVNNVLDEFGENPETTLASPEQHIRNLMWFAKITVDQIYKMRGPWSQQTGWFAPVLAQQAYDLPSNFRYLVDGLFYAPSGKADERTIEELYGYDPGRAAYEGQPSYFAIWDNQFNLLESPDSSWAANKSVLGTDANVYTCIKDHTATASNCPITGADYATYWALDTDLTTAAAWALGTEYVDGRVTYLYRRKPTHMANDSDYPDLPDYAIECLKAGMKAKYAKYRERDDYMDFYGEYKALYRELRGERPSKNRRGFSWMRRGRRS